MFIIFNLNNLYQNEISGHNCTPPAIDDFPADLFTRQQRQAGAVAFHISISLYLFLALAIVCDKYFVPAVERISQGTHIIVNCVRYTSLCDRIKSPSMVI